MSKAATYLLSHLLCAGLTLAPIAAAQPAGEPANHPSPEAPPPLAERVERLEAALAARAVPRAPDDADTILAGFDEGFVLRSADGVNSLRIVGLLQAQYAHQWLDGATNRYAFLVNRGRFGVKGTIASPDLKYFFLSDFGKGSPKLIYYYADYTVAKKALALRVGQFKRPFSRAFITPSQKLGMIDRPLTVGAAFGDDIDVGVMAHNGTPEFEYALGVFNGSGYRSQFTGQGTVVAGTSAGDPDSVEVTSGGFSNVPRRLHPAVTARVGYNHGPLLGYSESDLEGGPARFGIGLAGVSDFDADRNDDSFVSGVLDVVVKAYGFSLSSALYAGTRQEGSRWRDQHFSALGHYSQVGYLLDDHFEPVARYAFVMPDGATNDVHEVAGGLSVYLRGHALKWQTVLGATLLTRDGARAADVSLKSQLGLAL